MPRLDISNAKVRDIITNLIGDIYLYAKEKNLPVIGCVRDITSCFRDIQRKPSNELASKHESFVAEMIVRTGTRMYERKLTGQPSDPKNFKALAEVLADLSDRRIKVFVALMEEISRIHESGDEAEMDEFFKDMERFNEAMRK